MYSEAWTQHAMGNASMLQYTHYTVAFPNMVSLYIRHYHNVLLWINPQGVRSRWQVLELQTYETNLLHEDVIQILSFHFEESYACNTSDVTDFDHFTLKIEFWKWTTAPEVLHLKCDCVTGIVRSIVWELLFFGFMCKQRLLNCAFTRLCDSSFIRVL